MSTPRDVLRIGDLAKLTDTSLRTLRYYEEIGLLSPEKREDGGYRFYRRANISRVRMIRNLQTLGLQLDEIRALLVDDVDRAERNGDWREAWIARARISLSRHKDLVAGRRRELEQQEAELATALEQLDRCASCENTPADESELCDPCQQTDSPLPPFLHALF